MKRLTRQKLTEAARDGGFIIAVMSLIMTTLLVFAAFAVDAGAWYARSSQIQRATDSAALAGVVWMPDITKARSVALDAAKRNGFTNGGSISVQVQEVSGKNQQLRVTITDRDVKRYFSALVIDQEIISKTSLAEYVRPVPLGSPRNYFGTGTLNTASPENLWLSINTWCTDKVDGDQYQSRYTGNRPYSAQNCPNPASGTLMNDEYTDLGYEWYLELPPSRPYSTQVLIFDPQYRPGTAGSPDLSLFAGTSNFTFTLFAADNTPFDDSDNPPVAGCSRTFTATTANDLSYLGSSLWTSLCTLNTSAPAGQYILRGRNQAGAQFGAGANQFALVARPSTYAGNALCDSRTDVMCPRIYGKAAISVFASQSSSTADFYLSEIGAEHQNKTLRIELWDPGEGGQTINIRRPTGVNTWTNQAFSFTSSAGRTGTNVTSLDVTGSVFNGHRVVIDVSLAGYVPPAGNPWWQIRYNFGSSTVTDRTTWAASIIGDPVRLVSEN